MGDDDDGGHYKSLGVLIEMLETAWNSKTWVRRFKYVSLLSAGVLSVGAATVFPQLGFIAALLWLAAALFELRLEKLGVPRRLEPYKRASLVNYLLTRPRYGAGICYVLGNSEAEDYANDLLRALEDGGWQVRKIASYAFQPNVPRGLLVAVHDENEVPPAAYLLTQAFTAAGIAFGTVTSETVNRGEVRIFVGPGE